MTKRFQVSTRRSGRLRTMIVMVYKDLAELRKAGTRHSRLFGLDEEMRFTNALGIAHRYSVEKCRDDGTTIQQPIAGTIRVWEKALGPAILCHEVTHIASHIYAQDWLPDHGAPWDDIENEEVLCYLVGELFSKVNKSLYKYKCGIYGD